MTVRSLALRLAVTLLVVPAAVCSIAQNPGTGSYPYARSDSFGFDSINPGNLDVHFAIPIVSKPGRGGLDFRYSLVFDSLVWTPVISGSSTVWTPDSSWGLHGYLLNDGYKGFLSYSNISHKCYDDPDRPNYYEWLPVLSNYRYYDEFGASHAFNYSWSQCNEVLYGNGQTGDGSSKDSSGFSTDGFVVYSRSGATLNVPTYVNGSTNTLNGTITDSNGNEVTNNQNGQFTDTMGKTPLTIGGSGTPSSPRTFTYNTISGTATVTVYYTAKTVQTAFGCNVTEYGPLSANLPTSVVLGDGSSTYTISYESNPNNSAYVTGRIKSITLPTGGTINYSYTGATYGINCSDGTGIGLSRSTSVSSDGTTGYTRSSITSTASHTEITGGHNDQTEIDYVFGSGVPYETTRRVYSGSSSGGTLLARTDTCYNGQVPTNCTTQSLTQPIGQISIYRTIGTVENGSDSFYSNGLPTDIKEYDYGSGARGSLLRETKYTYAVMGQYITDKVSWVQQYDGGGNLFAQTNYAYDSPAATPTSGLPQHVSVSGPRGNLTAEYDYTSASTSLNNTFSVDDAGQTYWLVVPNQQPGGLVVNLGYDNATDTLLQSVTPPAPNGVSLASQYAFDANTGLLTSVTDPNGQKTSYTYDSMLRPTEVDNTDSASNLVGKTTNGYWNTTQVGIYSYQNSTTHTDTEILYDGVGRQIRTAVANGQGTNPWYQADTCYNPSTLTSFNSYRYQGDGFSGTSPTCSGSAGDTITYDPLGRVTQIAHGDGSSINYQYSSRATQVTDENGVSRISQVDGLGRITAVCEISSNSLQGGSSPVNCGLDLAGTGYLTTYSYDLPHGKTTVNQGTQQTRIFQTDWVGRPILVQEPESGPTTYSYAYNSTGLQVTRQRPQANQGNPSTLTTTTTQYDALGRVVSVQYNDGTPTRSYYYDASQLWGATFQNPKGRLIWHTVSNAQSNYSYDAMGRIITEGYCTPSTCGTGGFGASFSYDWLGNLLSSGDGSGTTSSYTYSPANEVLSVTSSRNDPTDPPNLVSNVSNGPFGPLSWTLGNGLNAVRQYDGLGRMTGGWVCSQSSRPFCEGGQRVYGTRASWKGLRTVSSDDSVMAGQGSYGYDEFNRLTSATWGPDNKDPNLAVDCSPNPVASGGTTVCTAHLIPGATGSVVFTYNNGNPWMTVNVDSTGSATTNPGFTGAPVASYTVTASYSGDSNFNPAIASTVFTVNPGKSTPNITVSCSPDPVVSGSNTYCQAHVPPGGTGTVVFTYNNGNPWMTVNVDSSGSATTAHGFDGAPVGSYTVTASYSGDNNFNPASASTVFTVNSSKSTPNVTLSCSPDTIVSGGTTACTAYVAGASSGTVTFTYNNGNPWMTVNLSSWGTATTAQGFTGAPNGVYTVNAAYSGDTNFNSASATTTINVVPGGSQGFSFAYDRWGNRWQQNVTAGSGPSPQYSFNTATNQISASGFAYDAAGNLTNDGFHTYSYDAEGNISAVDNGSTAQYTYDSLNQRVQTLLYGSYKTEYLFNPAGQRLSVWNGANNTLYRGQYYWGAMPLGFYYNGQTYFQHQDWVGTERMRTSTNGSVAATFTSLAFGDSQTTTSGSNYDAYHFGGLDTDVETGTDHAQFRQYNPTQGRWLSTDPSGGSYDFTNPQSFNRYAYVMNNPLSANDRSGLDANPCPWDWCWGGGGGGDGWCDPDSGDCGPNCDPILGCNGIAPPAGGGGGEPPAPRIKGFDNLDPNRIMTESLGLPPGMLVPSGDILLDALGLGSGTQCEFGACGPSVDDFMNGGHHNKGCNFIFGNCYSPVTVLFTSLLNAIHTPYHDSSDPDRRLFGTHYCGPGGGGAPTGGLDVLCAAHDACYHANGVSAIDNLNPFTSGSAMGGCDRLLCIELGQYHPKTGQEAVGKNQISQIFGCGYINR